MPSSTLSGRILVLGGTGFIGRSVCEQLVEAQGGAAPGLRVATRRAGHARHLWPLPGLEVQVADVHDDAALARLLAGCTAVVNLVAILHGSRAAFQHVHVELPRRLAAACARAGVPRLVHVSALGVPDEGPGAAPSDYLRSKAEGEAVLRAAAQATGLSLTLLRPSVVFGAQDRFLNLFAALQGIAPLMPLGGADARFQPVWVEDVARAVVACLRWPPPPAPVYECAGPQTYTLAELVRLAGRWAGRERPVLRLPAALATLQAAALEWAPGGPLMSRDNLRSMQVPNVASGRHPGLRELGIVPAALEAIAPQYLTPGAAGVPRLDRWRALARR